MLGCTGTLEADPGPVVWEDELFPVAQARPAGPLPRPVALDAPTPETPAGMELPGAPPWFRVRVRSTTPDGLRAVIPWADDDFPSFQRAWGWVDIPGCATLAEAVDAHPDLGFELASCGRAEDAARFTDPAMSSEFAVRWAARRGWHAPTPDVGLARAPELVARWGADDDVLPLLGQLCATDRPELAEGLRAVLAAAPTDEDRRAIAAACPNQSDPTLAAAWAGACTTCEAFDVLADLDASIDHAEVALRPWVLRHPTLRGAMLDALERCVRDPNRPYHGSCLAVLGELDRPRAQALVHALGPAHVAVNTPAGAALRRFGTATELTAHLVGLGVADGPIVADQPQVTVLDWFKARDRWVFVSGWELGDLAMRVEFAATRSGDLADVRFEFTPAPPGGTAFLRAWSGDRRWQVALGPDDDWEVHAVGLLNAVAVARRAPVRFGLTEEGWVWGPGSALRSLDADGLLDLHAEVDLDGWDGGWE